MSAEDGADIGVEKRGQAPASRKLGSIRSHEQLIGMIILSAAFIIGSFSMASGLRNRNQTQTNQITITGSAQQAVTSNTFQWTASVASTQPTTSAALAQLNRWTAQVRSALLAAGALNDEISFGTVYVQPNTQATGEVTSFTMSQTVTVQSSRLTAMQPVLVVSNHLLANNVPFIAQQPQYTFNGLKKLRPALTKEAAANARLRAQAALGKQVKLGKPISITVGQVSVDAPGSVNYGSGDFNTSSIPKVVSVVVHATYSTG
ncbi:MAG: SIMPL domain-containing protein [Acidimicrobiales bacterium]